MPETSYELHAIRVLECSREGKQLRTDRDAVDVIGEAMQTGCQVVVIPVERFDPDFFRLRTGVAGAIVQKFVQYSRRLVILGDVSNFVEESTAFDAFVIEANRGRDIWFVPDAAELGRRLQERQQA